MDGSKSSIISIHALLAESDTVPRGGHIANTNFYPRSPCGERLNGICLIKHVGGFLSTLSLRRATSKRRRLKSRRCVFLSTLSLRRATNASYNCRSARPISIHALLAESDSGHNIRGRITQRFLSTLSLRRATRFGSWLIPCNRNFYPRSPCGERPTTLTLTAYTAPHFYPRSPCGERLTLI